MKNCGLENYIIPIKNFWAVFENTILSGGSLVKRQTKKFHDKKKVATIYVGVTLKQYFTEENSFSNGI